MKQKLMLSTKISSDDKENNRLIRENIQELKKEIRKYTTSRVSELYRILNEIVKLKKNLPENRGVGKRYTFRSLEWEKDLSLTSMELRYIEAYQWISPYGCECVEKGMINDSAICHFLAISTLLREPKWQDKLIDKIIARQIKVGEVSELTKEELKLFLEGKLKKRIDDKYLFSSTKTLRSMLSRLKQREEVLKKSPYRDNLLKSINNLKSYLEGLQ